jgi:hypothetical protein
MLLTRTAVSLSYDRRSVGSCAGLAGEVARVWKELPVPSGRDVAESFCGAIADRSGENSRVQQAYRTAS